MLWTMSNLKQMKWSQLPNAKSKPNIVIVRVIITYKKIIISVLFATTNVLLVCTGKETVQYLPVCKKSILNTAMFSSNLSFLEKRKNKSALYKSICIASIPKQRSCTCFKIIQLLLWSAIC